MHNGFIGELAAVKRDLVLAIDPSLFASMEGSADTEVMFYLALTFGLEDDPPAAMEATVGYIEEVGRQHGVEHPIQMTVATTNGESVWAFRYSSERNSRSLFFTTAVDAVRQLHPELDILELLSDETRLIVSEPLRDLPGVWNEVPESSWGVVQPGQDEMHPFTPKAPTRQAAVPA
jgi:predicted glutamine amidotransferase